MPLFQIINHLIGIMKNLTCKKFNALECDMKKTYKVLFISLFFLQSSFIISGNLHFKKPTFQGPSIQKQIETNREQIRQFLNDIETVKGLHAPLPIAGCFANKPALFDLVLHHRNMDLIEIIVAKKLPLHLLRFKTDSLFEMLARIGKSKVMLGIIKLYKKYDLDRKSLINAKTGCGYTPLMAAALEGHRECVRVLLENGAHVHAALLPTYKIALHFATGNTHPRGERKTAKIVNLLCKAGADPDHSWVEPNHWQKNSIDIAQSKNLFEVVKILQAYHLHNCRKTYFSLLPTELLINYMQNYKPEISVQAEDNQMKKPLTGNGTNVSR